MEASESIQTTDRESNTIFHFTESMQAPKENPQNWRINCYARSLLNKLQLLIISPISQNNYTPQSKM